MEKVLWLMNMSKAVCEVSFLLRFLAGQCSLVGQTSWRTVTKSFRNKLRTINIIRHRRWPTYSKYPNQPLKIICTSLVMLIALMFGFLVSKAGGVGENDHISSWDSAKRHKKCSVFKTNCDGWWKVDTVWWCGMEELHSTTSHMVRPPQRRRSSPKESDTVYTAGLGASPLVWAPSENQTTDPNRCRS